MLFLSRSSLACYLCKTQCTLVPMQTMVTEFEGWASVQGDKEIAFDWDDAMGNTARREAGLKLEALRNAEIRRRKVEARGPLGAKAGGKRDVSRAMPKKGQTDF